MSLEGNKGRKRGKEGRREGGGREEGRKKREGERDREREREGKKWKPIGRQQLCTSRSHRLGNSTFLPLWPFIV